MKFTIIYTGEILGRYYGASAEEALAAYYRTLGYSSVEQAEDVGGPFLGQIILEDGEDGEIPYWVEDPTRSSGYDRRRFG